MLVQGNMALAQNERNTQFDFWIGKWDLYSEGSMMGTNTVDTILEGNAIEENFVEFPPDPFHGKSWTTFNAVTQKWEQTTVDNKGHHSFFTGEFKNDTMTLVRDFLNAKGEKRKQRMLFYNIAPNGLEWNFAVSANDGKTWATLYMVVYKRKK
jgi:hypothetical protein